MRSYVPRLALALSLCTETALAVEITSTKDAKPFAGVTVRTMRTASPATNAWAVLVDLCESHVHVDATKAPSSTRTTGAWAEAVGAQIATNGDFFKTGPVRVYGQAVGSGAPWPSVQTGVDDAYAGEWYFKNHGFIAFGRDWVDFSHTEWVKKHPELYPGQEGFSPGVVSTGVPPGTIALVSGFPELVVEGKVVTCSSPTASGCFPDRGDMRERHPRTAMGLSRDRRTFMLVVVDGRTSASAGMYGAELADLMGKLGAYEAFNLDGGGSSQLWQEGKGYLNDPDGNNHGGGLRAVANHWGVFAGAGNGKKATPGHCVDNMAGAVLAAQEAAKSTDVDGDGTADACLRGPDGVRCALGPTLGEIAGPKLSDDSGWADLDNATTLRMGDIDGDGRADLCARANAKVVCYASDKAPLGTTIEGPALSDDSGWGKPWYHGTMRLADIDGDGLDDLCARGSSGLRCYRSTGGGFEAPITTALFDDKAGFVEPSRYGTLRMGDIDADGKADVCARGEGGVVCHLSTGQGFGPAIEGPAWKDASGWVEPRFWSTIKLADVDGDGRADLCARSASDFRCHLSTGAGFGPALIGPALSDDKGWGDPANHQTIRLGDIDGDGDLDLCARANAGVVCWPFEGGAFGAQIAGPPLSDDKGWGVARFHDTIRIGDVNGDGKADLCARGGKGLLCFASTGQGFGEALTGPAWSGAGFEAFASYGSMMLAGPACRATAEVCNGRDDDCDGEVDEGCGGAAQGGSSQGGQSAQGGQGAQAGQFAQGGQGASGGQQAQGGASAAGKGGAVAAQGGAGGSVAMAGRAAGGSVGAGGPQGEAGAARVVTVDLGDAGGDGGCGCRLGTRASGVGWGVLALALLARRARGRGVMLRR